MVNNHLSIKVQKEERMLLALYGAIAGFIATWSISSAITASEAALGLPISSFYSIMGVSLGMDNFIMASYFGFALHLVVGTAIGSIIAIAANEIKKTKRFLFKSQKSIILGTVAGFAIWLVLFLPVTLLLVQPSADRISRLMTANSIQQQQQQQNSGNNINSLLMQKQSPNHSAFSSLDINIFFKNIAVGAIAFHIVWGAIFGFIVSSLIRIKAKSHSLTMGKSTNLWRLGYKMLLFVLISGLISSIAISAILLLVERMNGLPVGTFYYVLVSALTDSYGGNFVSVVLMGLGLHLFAGAIIGAVMAIPTIPISRLSYKEAGNHYHENTLDDAKQQKVSRLLKYSWAYGLVFGFGLWALLFVPITYLLVIPFLNSFQNHDVILTQYAGVGNNNSITFYGLLPLVPKILYGAIAFNLFYGLLNATLLESLSRRYMKMDGDYELGTSDIVKAEGRKE